jgi:hypothetical protein
MAEKTFNFSTGVTINLEGEKVIAKYNGGSSFIERDKIDNFSFENTFQSRLSPAGLFFRFSALIFALIIINSILRVGGWWDFVLGLVAVVIAFLILMVDSFLEINIYRRIINANFSNKLIAIKIGNRSGNNIEFIADLSDRSKVLNLEKAIEDFKKFSRDKINVNTSNSKVSPLQSSTVDELMKLAELNKMGVLTEAEFNSLKDDLLNKSKAGTSFSLADEGEGAIPDNDSLKKMAESQNNDTKPKEPIGKLNIVWKGRFFLIDVNTKVIIDDKLFSTESTKNGFNLSIPLSNPSLHIKLKMSFREKNYTLELDPNKNHTFELGFNAVDGMYSDSYKLY